MMRSPHIPISTYPSENTPHFHRAVMMNSAYYRGHSYGGNHPLAIPRVSLLLDLIQSYGQIDAVELRQAEPASVDELGWFHRFEYIEAIRTCQSLGKIPGAFRKQYRLGGFENPWFHYFFTIPATAAGASIQGADQVLAGRMAFNPAGGMHHAMPAQARGFCFFNDAVLGIKRLRQEGLRVLYIDMDAHHGDGVEFAFQQDPQVATCSFHMDTTYAYPFEGGAIGDSGPLNNAVNLPLPRGTHDGEYRHAYKTIWPRVFAAFRPDAVVLQSGTDILGPDPLGKFDISNRLVWEMVEFVKTLTPRHPSGVPRLLVLGGGGYHPIALARCWTGVWAVLSNRRIGDAILPQGRQLLKALEWDDDEDEPYFDQMFEYLADEPTQRPVREEIAGRVRHLMEHHPMLSGDGYRCGIGRSQDRSENG